MSLGIGKEDSDYGLGVILDQLSISFLFVSHECGIFGFLIYHSVERGIAIIGGLIDSRHYSCTDAIPLDRQSREYWSRADKKA